MSLTAQMSLKRSSLKNIEHFIESFLFLEKGEPVPGSDQLESREEEISRGDIGKPTKTIVVANVPSTADEDVLELLFESKRKGGGGPVKHIQINRQKNWAIVEFCEPDAIEAVISKLPITLMGTQLDIHPYTPLISAGVVIHGLDIRGLPKELTNNLLTKDVEGTIGSLEASSAEYESDSEQFEAKSEVFEQAGIEVVKTLKPIQLRILITIDFEESMAAKCPNVRVKINPEMNEVILEGNNADIQSVKAYMYETLSVFAVCVFDGISEEELELIKYERVKEYIEKKLASEKLVCLWEIEDNCLIVCSVHADVIRCFRIIRGSVKEEKFLISDRSSAVFWSTEWQNKLKELQKDSYLCSKVKSSEDEINAHIIARDDEVSNVVEKVKIFLKEQSRRRSEAVNVKQLGENFETFSKVSYGIWHKLFNRIISDLSIHFVSIEGFSGCYFNQSTTFTLTGTDEGRALAK